MKKLFKGLYHASFFVNDIEKSLEFYKACGFEPLFDLRVSPEEEPWNIFVRIDENQTIELQPVHANHPFPAPEKPVYCDEGTFFHIALLTDDLDDAIKELKRRGVTTYSNPMKESVVHGIEEAFASPDGCMVAWIVDPDGNPIEIMEQTERSLQVKHDAAYRNVLS
ncbi:MAG: VOC family protein [Eubacterium sp.]|nr:VOC family protein [Eubacterium sp.]